MYDPATIFIPCYCADEPSRVTDSPTSIAGLIPERNKYPDKNICPSVMLMRLVGMYAETSPASVSMSGNDVILEPPRLKDSLADLSKSRECTKNISPGYASLPGGCLNRR